MIGGRAGPRKLDLTRTSIVQAHVNDLWPLVTAVERWPEWFKDGRGRGLAKVEPLPPREAVTPDNPHLGKAWRFTFTNGMAAEFRCTYWVEPAQVSVGLVPATRTAAQGIEGMILDFDLFPQRDRTTQVWFGALLLMEKGTRTHLLQRWPKREVQGWVDGFHRRFGAEAPRIAAAKPSKPKAAAPA